MSRAAERAHAVRFYGAVALGIAAIVTGIVLNARWRETPRPPGILPPPEPGAIVHWCADGLEAIAGGGCFAAPPGSTVQATPAGLVVYLHGRYAPERAPEELERQARVARVAVAHGYAALALRGMQGQCTDPQLATWWCWPSNERNAADGARFTASWMPALAEVERRLGKTRRVLLGFSNGGYFAAMIASRALAPFDAVTIAHAGPVEPMHPVGSMPPILLIDADDDPSSPEILRLEGDLRAESWPHAMVIREGGHALPDWDVEMALTFFERARAERFPLSPPLAPQRPPHPHDASAPDAADPEIDPPSTSESAAPAAPAAPVTDPTPAPPSASAAAPPSATASAPPSSPDPTPAPADSAPSPTPAPVLDPPP